LRRFDPASRDAELLPDTEYDAVIESFQSGTYNFDISDDTFDPVKYAAFLRDIDAELREFTTRQAVALEKEKELEAKLFAEWEQTRAEAERQAAPKVSLDGVFSFPSLSHLLMSRITMMEYCGKIQR
jgi:hypothetical protein